jgi:ABC-2 type transport system permease protein
MNIFLRELKSNLRSLLIWGFIIVLFSLIGFSKFSAYEGNPEMLKILNDMPQAFVEMLNLETFNLTTVTGFLGAMFSYFALLLSVAAIMWGSDIITKEERDKTVEFSLTLPVTRGKLIIAKSLAAWMNCIGLLIITWAITLINASKYQPDSKFYQFLSLLILALFILEMIFLAIGILLGCAMKQYKLASSVAVALILVTYFLSIIAGLNKNLDFLKYLSPFSYFNPVQLLNESRFDLVFVWISLGIIIVSIVAAYITYSRRDLYI